MTVSAVVVLIGVIWGLPLVSHQKDSYDCFSFYLQVFLLPIVLEIWRNISYAIIRETTLTSRHGTKRWIIIFPCIKQYQCQTPVGEVDFVE